MAKVRTRDSEVEYLYEGKGPRAGPRLWNRW